MFHELKHSFKAFNSFEDISRQFFFFLNNHTDSTLSMSLLSKFYIIPLSKTVFLPWTLVALKDKKKYIWEHCYMELNKSSFKRQHFYSMVSLQISPWIQGKNLKMLWRVIQGPRWVSLASQNLVDKNLVTLSLFKEWVSLIGNWR